jgi:chemotaxis protein CheZ
MSGTSNKPEKPETGESKQIYTSVDNIQTQLESIEKFVARRFDEISMEINATSQQVEMTEEGIGARFAEILEILKAVSFSGDGKTPANAGVELDAVVEMTEMAATRILDAADRIGSRVHSEMQSDDDRKAAVEDIDKDIEEIFLACSFQDITGQRIRKTLENLKTIEDRLGSALDKIGIKVEDATLETSPVTLSEGATQDDIDALFGDD